MLLIGSLIALLVVLLLEWSGLRKQPLFSWAFEDRIGRSGE